MYKRKRAGNTITRKINSTKDTAAKADKNHYISNSYLEGFIPIDTEYFTASRKACFSGLPPEDAFINTAFYLYSLSASLSLFLSASPQFFQTCDSEHQLPACFIPAALPLQNSFLFFSAGLLQPLIFPSFWPPCAPLPAQRAFFSLPRGA